MGLNSITLSVQKMSKHTLKILIFDDTYDNELEHQFKGYHLSYKHCIALISLDVVFYKELFPRFVHSLLAI